MQTQLSLDPVQALEFVQTYIQNSVKRVVVSKQSEAALLHAQEFELTPNDHGTNARRTLLGMRRTNFQNRFINLVA